MGTENWRPLRSNQLRGGGAGGYVFYCPDGEGGKVALCAGAKDQISCGVERDGVGLGEGGVLPIPYFARFDVELIQSKSVSDNISVAQV